MVSSLWRRGLLCSALVALGVALVACGGAGAGGDGQFSGEVVAQRVAVAADRGGALRWDRATYEATAGDITFVVSNPSPMPHQFTVEGNGVSYRSKTFSANTTNNFTVKALPAGEYQIVCDYAGHRQAGMVARLIVR
jgi:plastocyanin